MRLKQWKMSNLKCIFLHLSLHHTEDNRTYDSLSDFRIADYGFIFVVVAKFVVPSQMNHFHKQCHFHKRRKQFCVLYSRLYFVQHLYRANGIFDWERDGVARDKQMLYTTSWICRTIQPPLERAWKRESLPSFFFAMLRMLQTFCINKISTRQ